MLDFERTETLSGENVVGIAQQSELTQESPNEPSTNGTEQTSNGERDLTDMVEIGQNPPSMMSRVPWGCINVEFIVVLHLGLFSGILSFTLAGNDVCSVNLLGADGTEHKTAVKWRFL